MLNLIAVVLALLSLGLAFALGIAIGFWAFCNVLRVAVRRGRFECDGRDYVVTPAAPVRPGLVVIEGGAA